LIVLITSTIFPSNFNSSEVRSVFTGEERLEQTKSTIKSLLNCGYTEIFLFDNSGKYWLPGTEKDLLPAKVVVFNQHQFMNKGISETLMLLDGLDYLPDNIPILKISGRYKIDNSLAIDVNNFDIAAKFYKHKFKYFTSRTTMATRCYIVKDKSIFKTYLLAMIEEIYSYSSKVFGIGSLKRLFNNQFFPGKIKYSFFDPIFSVEAASVRVIKKLGLKVNKMDRIGLSGLAGTFVNNPIED